MCFCKDWRYPISLVSRTIECGIYDYIDRYRMETHQINLIGYPSSILSLQKGHEYGYDSVMRFIDPLLFSRFDPEYHIQMGKHSSVKFNGNLEIQDYENKELAAEEVDSVVRKYL